MGQIAAEDQETAGLQDCMRPCPNTSDTRWLTERWQTLQKQVSDTLASYVDAPSTLTSSPHIIPIFLDPYPKHSG